MDRMPIMDELEDRRTRRERLEARLEALPTLLEEAREAVATLVAEDAPEVDLEAARSTVRALEAEEKELRQALPILEARIVDTEDRVERAGKAGAEAEEARRRWIEKHREACEAFEEAAQRFAGPFEELADAWSVAEKAAKAAAKAAGHDNYHVHHVHAEGPLEGELPRPLADQLAARGGSETAKRLTRPDPLTDLPKALQGREALPAGRD